MKFNFGDIKSSKSLLSKYSEEEIMERLGVPIEEGRFCSPYRDDKTPTCSLWRAPGNERLYFMDWAVFDEPVDVFDLYRYINYCSFDAAIEGLWELMSGDVSSQTLSVKESIVNVKSVSQTRVRAQTLALTEDDLRWWSRFGITKETLNKFNVLKAEYIWLGQDLIYTAGPGVKPGYVYRFFKDSIKVYFPHRTYNRFYHNDGSMIQGWSQLPAEGDLVIVTKSYKDVMFFFEEGIPAVAPQSESILLDKQSVEELRSRFTNVVVLMDNDRAGIIALRKYKRLGLKIYMLSRTWSKDISDFRLKYGANKTSRLIAATKWNLLNGGSSLSNFKL